MENPDKKNSTDIKLSMKESGQKFDEPDKSTKFKGCCKTVSGSSKGSSKFVYPLIIGGGQNFVDDPI